LDVTREKKNPIGCFGANRAKRADIAITPTTWTVTLRSLSRATSRMPIG